MEINHLYFAYGKKTVLKDLNLQFKEGKITTLLGANGCGKSTLLKLCTKNLDPKHGVIRLGKTSIQRIPRKEFAKKVAIVQQKNQIQADLTVKDLVSYGRTPYIAFMARPSQEDFEAVEEAIHLCGLDDLKDQKVGTLSGGQIQRAWIAMALAQDSHYLFLDEPTTYLDIKYQIEVLKLIKDLNQSLGKTIVMVLHDINQSIHFSHEIIGLEQGEVVFQGPPQKVLTEEKISQLYDTPLKLIQLEGESYVTAKEV